MYVLIAVNFIRARVLYALNVARGFPRKSARIVGNLILVTPETLQFVPIVVRSYLGNFCSICALYNPRLLKAIIV